MLLEDTLKLLGEGYGRLVTLYCGENVSRESIEELTKKMREIFSGNEFEIQDGGQPVYDLIISLE